MPLMLSARWPQGTYLGHAADGTPEPFPSFARAYSALVHAAATGTQAAATGDAAAPGFPQLTAKSVETLTWLESHPPIGMAIPTWPDLIPSRPSEHAIAYRDQGVIRKEGTRVQKKKLPRAQGEASWIGAPLSWLWETDPPAAVREHLDALCADVGTLGEADSPAVLEVFDVPGTGSRTHDLEIAGFFSTGGGTRVDLPAEGRLEALEEQFRSARPAKLPSLAADRFTLGDSAMPQSEAPSRGGLTSARLRPVGRKETWAPWELVSLLPIESGPGVADEDRVTVAVALHRALIATIGQDCPAVVTGRYGKLRNPPANRIALHYIPAGAPISGTDKGQAHLAILFPTGISETDAEAVHEGIHRLRGLRSPLGRFSLGGVSLLPGTRFWEAPAPRMERAWELDPAAVPERHAKGSDRFDVLSQTVAFSLGNVLREEFPELEGRSAAQRRDLLEVRGLEILEASSRAVADPTRFVHRTNRAMPVMPYRARLRLGDIVPQTAVLAIGQSRHLGGGLLVPVDRRAPKEAPHA